MELGNTPGIKYSIEMQKEGVPDRREAQWCAFLTSTLETQQQWFSQTIRKFVWQMVWCSK